MAEIIEGLDGAERRRIEALRRDPRYFWVDVSVRATSPGDQRHVARAIAAEDHLLHDLDTAHASEAGELNGGAGRWQRRQADVASRGRSSWSRSTEGMVP